MAGGMRGPGAAPLRMETDDQRKFGYGGDGLPPDDGGDDGNWEPGGDSGAPSPYGLFIPVSYTHLTLPTNREV